VLIIGLASCRAAAPAATDGVPTNSETVGLPSIPAAAPADPVATLTGLAIEAIDGLADAVLRIGADGFRLPKDEALFNVYGDRVLSARSAPGERDTRLLVRDLDGALIREIDPGFPVPQTGIVRGEDVYFGGIDADLDAADLAIVDRGVWIARGDSPPEQIFEPPEPEGTYHEIHLSPDGRTVGIWRCGVGSCTTILIGPDGAMLEIPQPGLVVLTNEVAVLIEDFTTLIGFSVSGGAELWRLQTAGLYFTRYAMSDGSRMVMSTLEDDGDNDGDTQDQYRIEVIEVATGEIQQTVLVPYDEERWILAPTLSTDRYVGLVPTILPDASEGPTAVAIVDLVEGRLLDMELTLGALPEP